LIRLAVRCVPELAEQVLAELTVLAPNGVEEERGAGYVEYAIYGGEGELPELGEIEAAAGDGLVEVVSTRVPDDWADRWQDFHKPLLVANRLWLRPSWEEPREGAIDVVVDPGQAFGTGAHPTTRLCLEYLLELEQAGEAIGPLTDLGTGSGVLAIAAATLGAREALGIDFDADAIANARENLGLNPSVAHVRFEVLDLREAPVSPADVVLANLTGATLVQNAARLGSAVTPGGSLIVSGLQAHERDDVRRAFAGATLAWSGEEAGWIAMLFNLPVHGQV
jgi:ribosomal protein L11 methyltransferase